MTTEIIGKACTGCGSFKLFSEYTKHKNGKYGFRSACKACTNAGNTAWRRNNPDASKAATKAWRDADPARSKASVKASREKSDRYKAEVAARTARAVWREANKEVIAAQQSIRRSAYAAAYRMANLETLKAANVAYKEKHREELAERRSADPAKSRAYNASYRAAHPGRHRIYDQNKRVLRASAVGRLSAGLSEKLFRLQRGKCPCCSQPLGDDYHLDHKMPLALGGSNTDDNMQLLRAVCNMQKHAKHPVDFMQSRGFLL